MKKWVSMMLCLCLSFSLATPVAAADRADRSHYIGFRNFFSGETYFATLYEDADGFYYIDADEAAQIAGFRRSGTALTSRNGYIASDMGSLSGYYLEGTDYVRVEHMFNALQTSIFFDERNRIFYYNPAGSNIDAMLLQIDTLSDSGIYTADLFDDNYAVGLLTENNAILFDIITNLKLSYLVTDGAQEDYNAAMMSIITPSGEAARHDDYVKARISGNPRQLDPNADLAALEPLVMLDYDQDLLNLYKEVMGVADASEFFNYLPMILDTADYLMNVINVSCGYRDRLYNVLQSFGTAGYGAHHAFAKASKEAVAVYDSFVSDPTAFFMQHGGREALHNFTDFGIDAFFGAWAGVDPCSAVALALVNTTSNKLLDTSQKNDAIKNVHFCKYLQHGFEGFMRTALHNDAAAACPTAMRDAMILYLKSAYASYEPLLFECKVTWLDVNDVTKSAGNQLLCKISDMMSEMTLYTDAMLTFIPNVDLPARLLGDSWIEPYYLEYLKSYEWTQHADYNDAMTDVREEAVGSIVLHDIDKNGQREMIIITNHVDSDDATAIVVTYDDYYGVELTGTYPCRRDTAILLAPDVLGERSIVIAFAKNGTQYEAYCGLSEKYDLLVWQEYSYPEGEAGGLVDLEQAQQLSTSDIYVTTHTED